MCRCVRKTRSTPSRATPSSREGDGEQPLVLRGPVPEAGPTPVSTRIVVPAERMRKELQGRQVSPAKSSGYSVR